MRPIARHVSAEDVVQEVLWRALSSGLLREFEDNGSGSLERVLSVILDRTLVDFGRRHGTQKRGGGSGTLSLDQESASESVQGPRPGLQETTPTSSARSNEILELCKRSLEPREWQAWELVEFGGLDSNEAAARLGVSASAVRGLILRARAKLVRALESRL
jgi:RNA polymerase sigma factor (sigma-70 family)